MFFQGQVLILNHEDISSNLIAFNSLYAFPLMLIWGGMYPRHMVSTELNADKNDLYPFFYLSLTELKKYPLS